jgi:hypothetical protein
MGMGCGLASHFPSPNVSWLYPMAYGAVAQGSAVSTMSKSMISGEIESYGESVMVERLEEAQGRSSRLSLVRVGGRRALFSSFVMKR